MKIEDARKLPAKAQEDIRREAVKAVLDGRALILLLRQQNMTTPYRRLQGICGLPRIDGYV